MVKSDHGDAVHITAFMVKDCANKSCGAHHINGENTKENEM